MSPETNGLCFETHAPSDHINFYNGSCEGESQKQTQMCEDAMKLTSWWFSFASYKQVETCAMGNGALDWQDFRLDCRFSSVCKTSTQYEPYPQKTPTIRKTKISFALIFKHKKNVIVFFFLERHAGGPDGIYTARLCPHHSMERDPLR